MHRSRTTETGSTMEELISQLRLFARGIWTHRWYAIGVMWLGALAGWATVFSLPSNYQASARVYVDTQSILKPLLAGMTTIPNVEQQVSIMSRTLLSRPNLERVMRMVDLDVRAASARQHERELDALGARIKITGTSSHDIYTISYLGNDPKLARDVVQSLLTIFVEGSLTGKRNDAQQAVNFIDDQIRTVEQRLVTAEDALKDFKIGHSGLLPRQGDFSTQLAEAGDALVAARLEMAEAEQARNAIRLQMEGEPPRRGRDRRPVRISNPEIDARIGLVTKELDTLRMQYTDSHPDIIAARRLIAQLEARKVEEARHPLRDSDPGRLYSPMMQQLKVALTEADARLASLRVRAAEFATRHARLLEQTRAAPEVEAQLAQLNRDYQVNKDNYEKLTARREAAKLSGELSSTTDMMTFKIIDPPAVPASAAGPDRPLLYSLALLGAIGCAILAAFLIGQARPTFSSVAQLREVTGIAVLGAVAMNWTAAELARRRRSHLQAAASAGSLLLVYAAVLGASWLHT